MTVELSDGRTLTGERDCPRGDYRDPMLDEEFRERTRTLLAHGLSPDRADEALTALDSVGRQPVRATTVLLTT